MRWQRTTIVRCLLGVYLVAFAALALYDTPLQPAVAEFFSVPSTTVPEAENGYFALLGFGAPAGADIHAFGRKTFQTAMDKAAQRRSRNVQAGPQSDSVSDAKLNFKGKDLPKDSFYLFMTGSSKSLDRLVEDNRELLARYQTLKRYRRIVEPAVKDGQSQDQPIPTFMPVRSIQTLALMSVLRQAHQGRVDEALGQLGDDLVYWRAVLQQGHTLITKLIAIACLQRDHQVLSEMIAHTDLSGSQRARIRAMLPPWRPEDTSFSEALRYEAFYLSDALFASVPQRGPLDRLFLKPNATRNAIARMQMANADMAALSADRFYKKLPLVSGQLSAAVRLKPDVLYNPIGAILMSIAVPQYSGYFARGHELEAKRRMVMIHLLAKEKGIGFDGMETFLQQLGTEYRNPYTNQPMQWDAKKKAIVMDSLPAKGKEEQRRVELVL